MVLPVDWTDGTVHKAGSINAQNAEINIFTGSGCISNAGARTVIQTGALASITAAGSKFASFSPSFSSAPKVYSTPTAGVAGDQTLQVAGHHVSGAWVFVIGAGAAVSVDWLAIGPE